MKVHIDLTDLVAEFDDLTSIQMDNIANAILKGVTMEIYRNWSDEAKQNLHSTRFQYIRGLQIIDVGKYSKAIVLNGTLPNMIESGVSAFDLKLGFSKSLKVKYNKKGGWYLTIPFRFATPDAIGESEVFSDVMPQEIYNIIKSKKSQVTVPYGSPAVKASPLLKSDLPEQFQKVASRKTIMDGINILFDSYTHKNAIYEGLQKSTGIYEKATQGSYNTFRRAGKNSNPLSWIHSGIKAYNLADAAVRNTDVDIIADNIIDGFL